MRGPSFRAESADIIQSTFIEKRREGVVPTRSVTHPSTFSSSGVRILIHQQLDLCIVSSNLIRLSYHMFIFVAGLRM